jgi:hypothetical protein
MLHSAHYFRLNTGSVVLYATTVQKADDKKKHE